MEKMKSETSCVVLGDVVGSRYAIDRAALHRDLRSVLKAANAEFGTDLRITVGDEYQGHVDSLGQAVRLTWWIRVHLLPGLDVRHGIGIGATALLDAAEGVEDGPGWWAARAAIEEVAARARRPRTRSARDLVMAQARGTRTAPSGTSRLVGALNLALAARDQLTDGLDARSVSVLCGVLEGHSQAEIARREGISPSAVSQRIRQDGLGVLWQMYAEMGEL